MALEGFIMNIKTNNHFRNLIYGYELTELEKQDFDYIDDIDSHDFFRYKGHVYDPSEFMRTPEALEPWQGYSSDSYFSGVVITYSDDMEQIKIGTYFS